MRFEFSGPHSWFRSALAVAAVVCLAIFTVLSVSSLAQQISGDITGTVLDVQGLGVANATVDAVKTDTGAKTTTKANDKGEYRLTNLEVGTYNLIANAPNFGTTSLRGVVVILNKVTTANLTLKVGAVETIVEVTGVAPLIDTTTAQLQTSYDTKQLEMLPVAAAGAAGAGILNLSLLSAGVAQADSVGLGTGPSVGGLRPRANNFTIEGVDNNNKSVTGAVAAAPQDATAEFSVLQNQFSSEYGHSSGGQFNVVLKSGTNGFHGSVYEYFENRNLDALDNSFVLAGDKTNPRWDNNRYGATLGGPIIKDKIFFFTLFDREPIGRTGSSGGTVYAPTAAGVAAMAAAAPLPPCSTQPVGTVNCANASTVAVPINATNLGVFKTYVPVAAVQGPGNGTLSIIGPCGTKDENGNANAMPFYGAPASGNCGAGMVPVGPVSITGPGFTNYMNLVQTIDWNISSKDQLRGRYLFNSIGNIDTTAQLPVFYTTEPTRIHLMNLSEFHTFGPHVNNELRLGFNRYALNGPNAGNLLFPGQTVFPNITLFDLGNAGLNIGPDPNSPQHTIQNFYQVVDNIAWVKGRHNLKFGGEYREYISPQLFTQRQRGDYYYTNTEAFLRDLTPDSFGERSSGSFTYYGNNWALYWFANDSIKVTPHLTVNLGIRYEYTTVTKGETNQALNSVSSDPSILPLGGIYGPLIFDAPRAPKNNWAPRLGIAYSPGKSGNTSIRAGFGTTYDVLYDNIGILSEPPQIGATSDTLTYIHPLWGPPCVTFTSAPCAGPGFLTGGALSGGGSGITVYNQADARAATSSWLPPDRKWPVSVQWNLGIQHSFGKAYSLEVRYLGVHAYHMDVQDKINQLSKVDSTHFLPTYTSAPSQATLDALPTTLAALQARPLVPAAYTAAGFISTGHITSFIPAGQSKYNGLATQFNRRFENGLQFQAAYTWSHNFDNSTADFFSTALAPRRPQDFQNINADWGTSALDRRHRFTMALVYDMPYFKNGNWFMKNLVGNWVVAPIYTYESPEYVTVLSRPTDSNLNGDSAPDRAILNPSGLPGTGSSVTALLNSGGAVVAYVANRPGTSTACTSAANCGQYIQTGAGALSTAPRNTLASRPTDNVDFSIVKRFALNERMRFEIGAVASNVFNHPQFIPGSINDVSGLGGSPINFQTTTQTGDFNYVQAASGAFNKPQAIFSSNSRYMTLTAKFSF